VQAVASPLSGSAHRIIRTKAGQKYSQILKILCYESINFFQWVAGYKLNISVSDPLKNIFQQFSKFGVN
jgi:hypothetical protein